MARKPKPSHDEIDTHAVTDAQAGDDAHAGDDAAHPLARMSQARVFMGWQNEHEDPVADLLAAHRETGMDAASLLPVPPTPHAEFCLRVFALLSVGVSSRAIYWLNTALRHEGDADYYDRLRARKMDVAAGDAALNRAATRAMGDTLSARNSRHERDKCMAQANAVMAADAMAAEAGEKVR